ncbi:hypothetical protein BPOR_0161g00110 [Botrytis porri]|uniref:Uncharacterized protein n=1 Tax=Botrytis porri TaxID=87229 RepID=A0A4Z1KVB5_9HELO|nr:hypothetical protein BPOR_0161g00110 [Botrytis porri]
MLKNNECDADIVAVRGEPINDVIMVRTLFLFLPLSIANAHSPYNNNTNDVNTLWETRDR